MNQNTNTTPGHRLLHRLAKVACALVLVAISISSVGCAGQQWWLDPGFAERLAAKEKKPLLFYFKAWDSTQHRNMKIKVFENPVVKQKMKGLIAVELEFAWSAPYDKRYKVHRSQLCVMCKPNGEMVGSSLYVNPVPTPEKFLEWLKRTKQEAMPPKPTTQKAPAPKSLPTSAKTKKLPAKAEKSPTKPKKPTAKAEKPPSKTQKQSAKTGKPNA